MLPAGQGGPHAPVQACQNCSYRKKKCSWTPGELFCDLCRRLRLPVCEPQDSTVSRRQRQKLAKLARRTSNNAGKAARDNLARTTQRTSISSGDGSVSGDENSASSDDDRQEDPSFKGRQAAASKGVTRNFALVKQGTGGLLARSSAAHATEANFRVPVSGWPEGLVFATEGPMFVGNPEPFVVVERLLVENGPGNSSDAILASIAAYFESCHVFPSIIHRSTFQFAFLKPSPIYKQKPHALLCAMAALGVRHAVIPGGLSLSDRMKMGADFCDRARQFLLAGYFAKARTNVLGAMSDMESVQTLILIYQYAIFEGGAGKAAELLERASDILREMSPSSGMRFHGLNPVRPANAVEWVRDELVRRVFISLAWMDMAYSYYGNRKPFMDYHSEPVILPAHEFYFDMGNAEEAFTLLYGVNGIGLDPAVVDCSACSNRSRVPDAELACSLVRAVIAPIFQLRASWTSIMYLTSLFRLFRTRLRELAQSARVNPMQLMAQDPSFDSVAEATYRSFVSTFDLALAEVNNAIPEEVAFPLVGGDAGRFLALGSQWFNGYPYLFGFLSALISLRSQSVENWLDGGDSGRSIEDAAFFASSPMQSILESSIVITRVLAEMMQNREWKIGFMITPTGLAALRAGFLDLATLRVFQSTMSGQGVPDEILSSMVHDVGVVVDYYAEMGTVYPSAVKVGASFRAIVAREIAQRGEEQANDEVSSFPMTMKVVDRWMKELVTS